MELYPVFLNLKNRSCLVVGGGEVASRKVAGLLRAGAKVRVVSPEISSQLRSLRRNKKVQWKKKPFSAADIHGQRLVVAATNHRSVNLSVAKVCRMKKIPVNVVDRPELCDFQVPSVIRRGALTLAISTGGASPALAKTIRLFLEKNLDKKMGRAVRALQRGRAGVRGLPLGEKKKGLMRALKKAGISL